MRLNYASPDPPVLRAGLAVLAGFCVIAFGGVAAWCGVHAVSVVLALEHSPGAFFCAEGAREWMASLGLPLERTIPLGVFCGGISLVALVQCIRQVNALRRGGQRRTA
jgi:hypothetical protein